MSPAKKKKAGEEEEEQGKTKEDADRVNKADKLPVIYAKHDSTPTCTVKDIVIFTNDKDPKANKTL